MKKAKISKDVGDWPEHNTVADIMPQNAEAPRKNLAFWLSKRDIFLV